MQISRNVTKLNTEISDRYLEKENTEEGIGLMCPCPYDFFLNLRIATERQSGKSGLYHYIMETPILRHLERNTSMRLSNRSKFWNTHLDTYKNPNTYQVTTGKALRKSVNTSAI